MTAYSTAILEIMKKAAITALINYGLVQFKAGNCFGHSEPDSFKIHVQIDNYYKN